MSRSTVVASANAPHDSHAEPSPQLEFEALILRKLQQKVSWRLEGGPLTKFAERISQTLQAPVMIDKAEIRSGRIDAALEMRDEVRDATLLTALDDVLRDQELLLVSTLRVGTPIPAALRPYTPLRSKHKSRTSPRTQFADSEA